MATTFELIKGETLTGSQASYTFSAIPSTFSDLCLKISARTDLSGNFDGVSIRFNSDSGTNYSDTYLFGGNSSTSSGRQSSASIQYGDGSVVTDTATATSNTFANIEIYIPSYTVSQSKPMSAFSVAETNAAGFPAQIYSTAALWRNNAAISSIVLTTTNGTNYVTGSSFYLYGVKNA